MGGLGPGIGGFEILVIGLVALLVVGPKDLPVMLRKLGRLMAKARAMATDFRSSFDEMARQTELDELRNEVEALRRSQMSPLGPEAEATFREINADLNKPASTAPVTPPLLTGPGEFADPTATPAPKPVAKSREARTEPPPATAEVPAGAPAKAKAKPRAAPAAKSASKTVATKPKPKAAPKPKVTRKKAVDL